MLSARELLLAGLFLAAGCAQQATSPGTKLSPAPILQDEAMALRQWDKVPAVYANGSSKAYPTLYPLVPRRDLPDWTAAISSPILFIGQTAFLPITALDTPPWQDTVYRGVYTPPTYTAVPLLEPDAAGYRTISKFPIPQRKRR